MAEIDRLVIKIVGDAQGYLNELRRVSEATSAAANRIASQSNVIAGFFSSITNQARGAADALSALGSGKWLRENLNFFGQMESASMRLTAAIEANGQAADLVKKDYDAFTDSLVRQTTVTRMAAAQMFQMAEGMGVTGDAAMRAVKNTVALMASRKELSQTRALGMTVALEHGRTGPIERTFRMLGGIKDPTERLKVAQEQLTKAWDQALAEAGSFSGMMTRLGNDLWWLANRYGDVIAEGAKPFVEWLRETVQWLSKADEPTKRFAATLGVVVTSVTALLAAIRMTLPLVSLLLNPWGIVGGVIIGGITLWVQSMGGLDKAFEAVIQSSKELFDWFKPIGAALKDVFGRLLKDIFSNGKKVSGVVNQLLSDIFGDFSWNDFRDQVVEAIYYVEYLFENLDKTSKTVWESITFYGDFAWSWLKLQAARAFDYMMYQAARAFDYIAYFFKDVLPSLLKWAFDNWESIWELISDFTINVVMELLKGVASLFVGENWDQAWLSLLKAFVGVSAKIMQVAFQTGIDLKTAFDPTVGAAFTAEGAAARARLKDKWEFLWKDTASSDAPQKAAAKAMEGVNDIIEKLGKNKYKFGKLDIPAYVTPEHLEKYLPSALVKRLEDEFNQVRDKINETWPEFIQRRLSEMKNSGEIINEAEGVGTKVGEAMTKGLQKETKKFDHVLYGSAAHLRRIAEYTAQLYGQVPRESVVGKNAKYQRKSEQGGPFMGDFESTAGNMGWSAGLTQSPLESFLGWAMGKEKDFNLRDVNPKDLKSTLEDIGGGKGKVASEARRIFGILGLTDSQHTGPALDEWQEKAKDDSSEEGQTLKKLLDQVRSKVKPKKRSINVLGDMMERPDEIKDEDVFVPVLTSSGVKLIRKGDLNKYEGNQGGAGGGSWLDWLNPFQGQTAKKTRNRFGGDDDTPFKATDTYHQNDAYDTAMSWPKSWFPEEEESAPSPERKGGGGMLPPDDKDLTIIYQKDEEVAKASLDALKTLIDILRPKAGGKVVALDLED